MPLYLLARDRVEYDEYESVLVRAPTETMARACATTKLDGDQDNTEWMSCPCKIVTEEGPLEIITTAFRAG